ncbi:MAG: cytochrome b [Deltaproteobacteria bacterium]|nr:cytochrome b [Deltaproteobacteria bacterium]
MKNNQGNGVNAGTVRGYTLTAVSLHWATAVIVISAAVLGIYMHELPFSPMKLKLYSYHKWMGVTVFLLALIRLAWRSSHVAPALPDNMPLWEQRAAKGAHAALYVFMIAVPLAGWVMSSAHGFQTVYLGILPIPDLIGKNKELAEVLEKVHGAFSLSFMALVVLHGAAALKHHFINRDNVLRRMLGLRSLP